MPREDSRAFASFELWKLLRSEAGSVVLVVLVLVGVRVGTGDAESCAACIIAVAFAVTFMVVSRGMMTKLEARLSEAMMMRAVLVARTVK